MLARCGNDNVVISLGTTESMTCMEAACEVNSIKLVFFAAEELMLEHEKDEKGL